MKKQHCRECGRRMTETYWQRRQARRTFRGWQSPRNRKYSKWYPRSFWDKRDHRRRFQFWTCKRCRLRKKK